MFSNPSPLLSYELSNCLSILLYLLKLFQQQSSRLPRLLIQIYYEIKKLLIVVQHLLLISQYVIQLFSVYFHVAKTSPLRNLLVQVNLW